VSFFGPLAIVYFMSQSVAAFSFLELVNYMEHYGLQRRAIAQGKYARVTPMHSWNANQLLFNLYMFRLGRHADHHAHPTRRYQALRHDPETPQLPFGYPIMILLALIPPLWFKAMDPRVDTWYAKQEHNVSAYTL